MSLVEELAYSSSLIQNWCNTVSTTLHSHVYVFVLPISPALLEEMCYIYLLSPVTSIRLVLGSVPRACYMNEQMTVFTLW